MSVADASNPSAANSSASVITGPGGNTSLNAASLLSKIISDDSFRPADPKSIPETGLSATAIEELILKYLLVMGSAPGRKIAEVICLPFVLLEPLYGSLRQRQLISFTGNAPLNDYVYTLTDQGRTRSRSCYEACSYVGAAPVPLVDYVTSVEAQTVRNEAPKRRHLEKAFAGISVEPTMFEQLGPAVNSGAGMFLYGMPGNGKTTLAKRITACYGAEIWVPQVITEDGQMIKLFDTAFHEVVPPAAGGLLKQTEYDRRWIRIRRPTVIVGGELTMEQLEIRHDARSNVSEASLQLKSNCGCLLIDDFGRQRMQPMELLNRWIVPLENRIDYLALATGKKITVPFEQLIIFSTNLEPKQLADEAFLRRIPYKIEVGDPDFSEFCKLFQFVARMLKCQYNEDAVRHLVDTHYTPKNRPLRRCQPRDLLTQVANYCKYNEIPLEMKAEFLDKVVPSYFTVTGG
jgi:predicted ATPase with chaperone activity